MAKYIVKSLLAHNGVEIKVGSIVNGDDFKKGIDDLGKPFCQLQLLIDSKVLELYEKKAAEPVEVKIPAEGKKGSKKEE